jgi:two-component system heavy metal sensor histidine kinase CusS
MLFARRATRAAVEAVTNTNSLLAKLVRWQLIALLLLIVGVCSTLYWGLIAQSNWVGDQTMEKRYLTVRGLLNSESERDYWLGHEVSEDMEGPRRIYIRVLMDDGAVVQETPDMASVIPAANFPAPRAVGLRRASIEGLAGHRFRIMTGRAPIVVDGVARSSVVQVAIDTTLDEVVLSRFGFLIAAVALVAMLGSGLLSAYHFSRLLAPLEKIADDVKRIDQNNLDRRIDTDGMTAELHLVASQFNAMVARLQLAYQGLKNYADNVAHEIRTPLNKMLLGLNVAQQHERTREEYEEFIAQWEENSRELSTLVERLLFLARASSGQTTIMRQLVDLRAELRAIEAVFEASASEAGVSLRVEPAESVAISADRALVQRAVSNLVANAIAHTPKGGSVTLSARQEGEVARVEVVDTGEGIAADHLSHVFDRFYRAEQERASGGRVGLGLAITKSIVDLHGGHVTLESELGAGTRATIVLPLFGPNTLQHA